MHPNQGWEPRVDDRRIPVYTRNPITQTVACFQFDSERKMKRTETEFSNLGGLNWIGKRFNRLKGVVELGDKTHSFHHRYWKEYRETISRDNGAFRLRSNPISQYLDDSITHHDLNPFRVGR